MTDVWDRILDALLEELKTRNRWKRLPFKDKLCGRGQVYEATFASFGHVVRLQLWNRGVQISEASETVVSTLVRNSPGGTSEDQKDKLQRLWDRVSMQGEGVPEAVLLLVEHTIRNAIILADNEGGVTDDRGVGSHS